jgi:phage head maturation protease
MQLFANITKFDSAQRLVYGYASTETRDTQGEIVKREAIEAALPAYMRFGNIREMHQPSAVGVATAAELDDRGLYVVAKVVDDAAWEKVVAGVYKGFSIGGRVVTRDTDDPSVITACSISEISLADRPANPECVFDLWKADAAFAKVGARHSKADLERVQQMHDTAVELGACCAGDAEDTSDAETEKRAHIDDLAKRTAGADALSARLDDLGRELASLQRRLAKIEAAPLPPKGSLRAIAKGEDVSDADGLDRADDALAAIRKAQARPIPLYELRKV